MKRSHFGSSSARRLFVVLVVVLLAGEAGGTAANAEVRTGRLEEPQVAPGWTYSPTAPLRAEANGGKEYEPLPEKEGLRSQQSAVDAEWPAEPSVEPTPLDSSDTSELILERVRDLTINGRHGRPDSVLEPSVGGDRHLLVTGNHFAALSNDAGATFRGIDPSRFVRWEADETYCCDQVVAYDSARSLLIWLVQSQRLNEGDFGKSLKLLVSGGADRQGGEFRQYTLAPQTFGWPAHAWFDFSDLVVGGDFLYLTALLDVPNGDGAGVVIRLPLDALAEYREMDATAFAQGATYLRAVRGAGSEMVLAATGSYEEIWIWRWPEEQASPDATPIKVGVEPWSEPNRHGEKWLERVDGTLMAAWAEGRHLGFAWTSGHTGAYPRPHLRVAILDRETLELEAQPHLWNRTIDFAFPAIAVSRHGLPGLSVLYDDDDGYPGHAVGVLIEPCAPGERWRWEILAVRESATAAMEPWGDYLAIVPDAGNFDGWLATGYALDDAESVRPHLVWFSTR